MIDNIQVLGDAEAKRMFDEIGKQAPFALKNTLNGLANATQEGVRDTLDDRFTLRRGDFVKRTIYRKPGEDFATKMKLEAGVRVNPERDFLAKFEDGGVKEGKDGHRIAIPLDVRRNKSEVVTKANRPRQVLLQKRVAIVRDVIIQSIGRGLNATKRKLYVLRRSVRIEPKLGMAKTARDVTAKRFDDIAGAEIDRALRSAK